MLRVIATPLSRRALLRYEIRRCRCHADVDARFTRHLMFHTPSYFAAVAARYCLPTKSGFCYARLPCRLMLPDAMMLDAALFATLPMLPCCYAICFMLLFAADMRRHIDGRCCAAAARRCLLILSEGCHKKLRCLRAVDMIMRHIAAAIFVYITAYMPLRCFRCVLRRRHDDAMPPCLPRYRVCRVCRASALQKARAPEQVYARQRMMLMIHGADARIHAVAQAAHAMRCARARRVLCYRHRAHRRRVLQRRCQRLSERAARRWRYAYAAAAIRRRA